MHFYDEEQYPIATPKHTVQDGVFLIAWMDDIPKLEGSFGLFIEDDGNFHLKCTFNGHWLKNLEEVAKSARLYNG